MMHSLYLLLKRHLASLHPSYGTSREEKKNPNEQHFLIHKLVTDFKTNTKEMFSDAGCCTSRGVQTYIWTCNIFLHVGASVVCSDRKKSCYGQISHWKVITTVKKQQQQKTKKTPRLLWFVLKQFRVLSKSPCPRTVYISNTLLNKQTVIQEYII